jgi:hypothetical protein
MSNTERKKERKNTERKKLVLLYREKEIKNEKAIFIRIERKNEI